MTSYLRSWLSSGTSLAQPASPSIPTVTQTSPQPEDAEEDGESDTETERDESDIAPAFPSLNSAQRASSSSSGTPTIVTILTDTQLMPPPPLPSLAVRQPGVKRSGGSTTNASLSAGNSLMPPPTTTTIPEKPKKGAKVALAPGHSPLDWAALKSSGADLRGVDSLMRIPPSELKLHRRRDDAWSAFNGKVYNITAYLPFHPGGEKELMRVAGRDGTKLFAETHAWVNLDFMLDSCLVGFLVPEPSDSY